MNFKQLLTKTQNIACMGLDPVLEKLPQEFRSKGILGAVDYYNELFELMKSEKAVPGAFKPNQGFYLIHDRPFESEFDGSKTLAGVISMIWDYFPDVPVILDFKRGDIGRSSKNYAYEGFNTWSADAVTVSPFMGLDSIEPFLQNPKRGAYLLNITSNPGSKDIQRSDYGQPVFLKLGFKIMEWSEHFPNIGAVVGATSPKELRRMCELYSGSQIPLLIPGVGTQGGSAKQIIEILEETNYDKGVVRINSSSGLTHPWENSPEDWREVCIQKISSHISSCNL